MFIESLIIAQNLIIPSYFRKKAQMSIKWWMNKLHTVNDRGLDVCASPQPLHPNSYVEILMPNEIVLNGRGLGRC